MNWAQARNLYSHNLKTPCTPRPLGGLYSGTSVRASSAPCEQRKVVSGRWSAAADVSISHTLQGAAATAQRHHLNWVAREAWATPGTTAAAGLDPITGTAAPAHDAAAAPAPDAAAAPAPDAVPQFPQQQRHSGPGGAMTRSDAALLALAVLLAAGSGLAIRCYECVHNSQRMKRQQRYVYPCNEYDGGELYVRDCPDSQLCIYTHISLPLATDAVVTVHTMDGCTPNSTSLSRYSEAGLVKAGCIQHRSRYKPPSSIYCYCDYDLCNGPLNAGASSTAPHPWYTAVGVLWALLATLQRPPT